MKRPCGRSMHRKPATPCGRRSRRSPVIDELARRGTSRAATPAAAPAPRTTTTQAAAALVDVHARASTRRPPDAPDGRARRAARRAGSPRAAAARGRGRSCAPACGSRPPLDQTTKAAGGQRRRRGPTFRRRPERARRRAGASPPGGGRTRTPPGRIEMTMIARITTREVLLHERQVAEEVAARTGRWPPRRCRPPRCRR